MGAFGKMLRNASPLAGALTGKGTFGALRSVSPAGQLAKKAGLNDGKGGDDVERPKDFAKGGKAKCYAEGGDVVPEKDPFDVKIDTSSLKQDLPDITRDFGATFKDARSSGAKTFDWKGKSYGTQLKGEGAPTPTSTPTKAKAAPAKAKAQNPFRDAEAKASKAKAATPKPARGRDFGMDDWKKEKPGDLRIGKPRISLKSDKPAPAPTKKAAAPAPVKKAAAAAPAKKASTPDWAKGGARKLMEPKKRFGDKGFAKGGEIQRFAKGGSIDGIAKRGKTRCKKV